MFFFCYCYRSLPQCSFYDIYIYMFETNSLKDLNASTHRPLAPKGKFYHLTQLLIFMVAFAVNVSGRENFSPSKKGGFLMMNEWLGW